MCFKHYNPKQVVMGRTMEEWLRFSVCFWHTFRGTGQLSSYMELPNMQCSHTPNKIKGCRVLLILLYATVIDAKINIYVTAQPIALMM